MYSHLEEFIYELYTSIGIKKPEDLDMDNIAKKLGIKIVYRKRSFRFNNEIVLARSTKQGEWMSFGHEVTHYLRHSGNQLNMNPLFRDLQEFQANHFAYHFCVPTFMLEEIKDVTAYEIMNQFNVDFDFALRRFEIFKNKIYFQSNYYVHRKRIAVVVK
ncbi:ImmA/IrrE family metallo-endopeptidase [Cytobacillus sp. OWB-43]|uniref:ImmA/IrrE family metallo-endopeptidase n=1 Tax=Cytobacillus sp. OWB-43 TaxID=3108468 RepID=UPI002B0006F6|nr:ImmA/IrrE family metallo-endopeptidase [Cytobacillus sp. OWB-43]MEA1855626.1 ImmA/IrrE family metallo-endopeptidase [Cytobacillus sp. OWB-43]